MTLEQFANTYQTTLNDSGGISSGDTSMIVTSATGSPSVQFRVKIDNELILVTAKSGTTFTITRGIEGSSAASHSDGATVTHVLTAASLSRGIKQYRAGDMPPATAGTYDEEWEGTADTLPTDWAWTSAPSGSDGWFLNSRWPSLITVEGTGATSYTLTRTNFTAAAQFGIWVKFHLGPFILADQTSVRLYVSNSGATEQRGLNFRATGAGAVGVRGLRIIASAETVWGAESTLNKWTNTLYVGMTRDGSNNFTAAWMSTDGIAWERIATSQAHTITIDRIRMLFNTSSVQSMVGCDWIRYRTDNAFPRP